MALSVEYLEKVITPIIEKFYSERTQNDFACALGYYKSRNYEAFDYGHPAYDGRPDAYIEDTFRDLIANATIVVEKETELDVGDNGTELKTLGEVTGEKLYYSLSELFVDEAYDDDFLTIDDKGNIDISPKTDDEVLLDAISDDTGYLVQHAVISIVIETKL